MTLSGLDLWFTHPPIYAELVRTYDFHPTDLPDHDLASLLAQHPAPIRDQENQA